MKKNKTGGYFGFLTKFCDKMTHRKFFNSFVDMYIAF